MNCKGNLSIIFDWNPSGLEILAERGRIMDVYEKLEKDPLFPYSLSLGNYPLAEDLLYDIEFLIYAIQEFDSSRKDVIFDEYLPKVRNALKNMFESKFAEEHLEEKTYV
jgi:hypothetical protein